MISYRTVNKLINGISELKFFIAGLVALICSLFPLRTYDTFVGLSQIDFIAPVIYCLVILLTLLFMGEISCVKNYSFRITPIDAIVMAYMLYSGIRFAVQYRTVNPETLFEFITLVILYFIFRGIKRKFTRYLLLLFPLAGIAQIEYGIANQTQYFMPGYGLADVTGVFNNTGILGGFMSIAFVATLGLPIKNTDSKRFINRITFLKILRVVILFLFFIQLVASHSRAAWFGCLAGCVYFIVCRPNGIFQRFVQKNSFRKLLMGVVIGLSVVALLIGLYTLRKDSANGRLLIWKVSLEMVKDKPVFGHGINGFQANYMEYQARYFASHPDSPFSNLADNNLFAFNEVLKLLVERGIVGLLLLGALGYVLFIKTPTYGNKAETREATGLKASLVALFAFGCFSYPTDVFQMNVILIALIAPLNPPEGGTFGLALHSLLRLQKVTKSSELEPDSMNSRNNQRILRFPLADFMKKRSGIGKGAIRAGLIIIFGIVATVLTTSVLRYEAVCRNWEKGLKQFSTKPECQSIKLLQSCYPALRNNGVFLANYGKALTLSGAYTEAIPVLLKANTRLPLASNYMELGKCYRATGNTIGAKEAWIKASRMIPSLFTPKYLLAKMQYETGNLSEARNLASQLLEKKPKIRSPETDSIQKEMARMVEATN